jgi:hypothetical protein
VQLVLCHRSAHGTRFLHAIGAITPLSRACSARLVRHCNTEQALCGWSIRPHGPTWAHTDAALTGVPTLWLVLHSSDEARRLLADVGRRGSARPYRYTTTTGAHPHTARQCAVGVHANAHAAYAANGYVYASTPQWVATGGQQRNTPQHSHQAATTRHGTG